MCDYFIAGVKNMVRYISCGRLMSEESFLHAERSIDSYVLLVGIKNNLYIQEEDMQYVLGAGQAMILQPFKKHYGYARSEALSYFWCHFYLEGGCQGELIEKGRAVDIFHLVNEGMYANPSGSVMFPKFFTLESFDRVSILFHQLLDLRSSQCSFSIAFDCCVTMLLFELTRQAMEADLATTAPNDRLNFSEISQWIRINIDRRLTVKEIAQHFNYNPNYLSWLFKSKTGYSLIKYIHKLKIDMAKEMLLTTNKTAVHISIELGFSDSKHFLKLFKQMTDMTPSQYKNAHAHTYLNKN